MTLPRNPIVLDNCPDPAAFVDGDDVWLVCTTNDDRVPDKFPLRHSRDLATWTHVGHIFPRGQLPEWAVNDFWAPEIHRQDDGFICYFTARDRTGVLCLGAARAARVEGPWEDLGHPMLRDDKVGMIDAHRFDDDDCSWLFWKADGNAFDVPLPTPLFVQQLAADGITLVGPRSEILTNDLPWEGTVVEGPWVVRRPDGLYLFYAANVFNSRDYATGVARSPRADQPFEKLPEPLLRSTDVHWGPGHGCAIRFGGRDLFVYHAWEPHKIDAIWNEPTYPRRALVDEITWGADGWPRIGTTQLQAPSLLNAEASALLFVAQPRLNDDDRQQEDSSKDPLPVGAEGPFEVEDV